jgi:hypothetical protein
MLDTPKRSSANESALFGGSLKSSRAGYIEQRVMTRNVMLGYHRPFCADCDAPMILSLLEQDKPGFELRTFACPMCAATESIVVRVWPASQ